MKRFVLLAVIGLFCALALHAEEKSSNLHFVVVKADTGKPIRNASVVLHPVGKDGHQSHGGFELKTDLDGKANFAGAPYGKLRVQVLVRGFQTYGQDFDVNQPRQEITIKLQRPKPQYSIYENAQPDNKQADKPK